MSWIKDWRKEFNDHKKLILISLIFFAIALFLTHIAGIYVNKAGSNTASDIILDKIPPIDLSFLFIYGATIIILVLIIYPLIFNIKEFHNVISQFSLLVLIRSFFISLTHLKAPADAIFVNLPYAYNLLIFNNDLFFSAHTAIPFLGYLLFRNNKIGIFFLISTAIMATTVLLMHIHYSIDVFAAIFITYGSYEIGKKIMTRINGN